MNGPRHLLVRASAGTGKTYQLTNRYLALLLDGAEPSSVLATTFTRKAAHEILDRVLARLAEAAKDEAKLAPLSEAAGRKVSREECLDLLARLLRGLDRVRIGTIDAFFAQLARLFALDIGLPAGWRIADETEGDLVRSDAVADAVAGAQKVEFLELLRDLQRQAVGQSVHRQLLEFVKIGGEALLESRREAWTRIEPLPAVDAKTLAAAISALPNLSVPRTKSGKSAGSEKTHWASSKRRLIECTTEEDWPGVLDVSLAKKICEGETHFDRTPIEAEHLEVLRPIVARALREVTEQLARQNRAARALLERHEESYQALCRGRGLLGFSDIPEALAPIASTGSDADRTPGNARRVGIAHGFDLEHRLDGRIDHLLLDEFQDTAPVQWRVLRPIADEILNDASGEKSFFCVGDVKQSIYGWRAAEPRLLKNLEKKRPGLATEILWKSHRSSRAVLGTVNEVFEHISGNDALTDGKGNERTAAVEAAEEFEQSFKKHEPAATSKPVPPGAVCVWRTRTRGETDSEQAPALELAVERARSILGDAPRAKIGILTRRRKWIPELIQKLREAGIPASDEGGNPLTDSVAVLHALSLLHLADHPGDLSAAFHVATSPLGARVARVLGAKNDGSRETSIERSPPSSIERSPETGIGRSSVTGSERSPDASVDRSQRSRIEEAPGERVALSPEDFRSIETARARASDLARAVRQAIAESSYGGFLASIRPQEGGGYSDWDLGRFGQLIDLALAWEPRAGSRPRAFVEHVRKTKVEDPSAEQVRVMTVHGAKGLEFDAVILPELDGQLARKEDRLLTLRPDPEGEIEVVTHGLKKEISAAHPELERVRESVAKRRMVEELCVLYVAMTRAKHRLDLIVQGREKESGSLTFAAILRGALRRDGMSFEVSGPQAMVWEHPENTKPWFGSEIGSAEEIDAAPVSAAGRREDRKVRSKRRGADAAETAVAPKRALRFAASSRPRSLPGLSPSRAKDVGPVKASELLNPHDAMTARGRLIHRFLEEVEWMETFDRSDEELMAIGRRIEADEKVVASALAEFRAAIARPVTKGVLSKPKGDVEVWRERRFALVMKGPDGEESLWSGAFDRVVIERAGGRATSAQIIDYKTDRVEAIELAQRAKTYGMQLESYQRAAAHITGLNPGEIATQVLFLSHDAIAL